MTPSSQGGAHAFRGADAMRVSRDGIYRAVWRWHFYAGLLCLPFLVLLSTTGAIYLFKDEINATLFAHRTEVAAQNRAPLSASRLVYTASEAVPGGVPVSFTGPALRDRPHPRDHEGGRQPDSGLPQPLQRRRPRRREHRERPR